MPFQKGNQLSKGLTPWNKGKKLSEGQKEKMSSSHQGKHHSKTTRKKIGLANSISLKGRKIPIETKNKMSESQKIRVFQGRNNFWMGGISFELYSIDWTETLKKTIRERDNYVCQLCGKSQIDELKELGRKLAVHHIDYNKKNCNPDNLMTLCQICHMRTNSNRNYWINHFKSYVQQKI